MSSPGAVIETEGLAKHFRRTFRRQVVRAVDGISLTVEPAAAFGLQGPNGSGKTTFVKLLLGVIRPTAGQARLFGRSCQEPEARRRIGYLPENHRFPTYNTGRQMLEFYAALSGVASEERKRRAGELLERVALDGWGDVRVGKYSKGMLQRLGLAQALMHRPSLLILDEPSDGVDPVGRRLIREILEGLRQEGTAIFLNSHLLAEVELFCERVAIIRRGEVAWTGRVRELTAGSGYRLTAVDVTESALSEIRGKAASVSSQDGMLHLDFPDREAANLAIDVLRRDGVRVEELRAQRSTLEEVFVRVVQEARKQ